MSFVAFPYDFSLHKKSYRGEIKTITGEYAGGSVKTVTSTSTENGRTSTSTSRYTTVNVRMANGKVKSVVKDGTVNIPSGSAVTIFYYKKGEYLYPYDIYVHDTEKLFSLGKKEQTNARRALSGWGAMRRLWGRTVDLAYFAAIFIGALLACIVVDRSFRADDWVLFASFIAALIGLAVLMYWPLRWLGGTLGVYSALEEELNSIGFRRAAEIEQQLRTNDNVNNDVMPTNSMMEMAGLSDGAAVSNNSQADFKPMF